MCYSVGTYVLQFEIGEHTANEVVIQISNLTFVIKCSGLLARRRGHIHKITVTCDRPECRARSNHIRVERILSARRKL